MKSQTETLAVLLSAACLLAGVPRAAAQSTEEKVTDLDERLTLLERKAEVEAEKAESKAKDAANVTAGIKDGFTLRSADGSFVLRLRGYVHFDGRFHDHDRAADTFGLRRARPIMEGTLGRMYDFRIMPDFGAGTASVQDAWLEARFHPMLKVRGGKFKAPVGLERLQSATDILFVERALPTNLVPNRDLGLQLGGDTSDGVLSYQVGIFNGVPDGGSADLDLNDNKETDARVFLHPFRRGAGALWGLGVGVSGTYGTNRGTTTTTGLAPYRTTGQQTFFSYLAETGNTVVAAGTRSRISPQGYFYAGRFGLMAEYVRSSQEVAKGTSQADLTHASWQTTGSFLLTDDKAGYKQTAPKNPYDGMSHGPGAWEIKARYSQLDVDGAAFPVYANPAASARKARAWGVGVNWYLSHSVKAVIDGEQTKFEGGAAGETGVNDRDDELVLFSRFQVAF